ncbi:hydroxymethylbilane synthase [Desulfovibrio sp. PG-178-WT-4]|uniref:Porphobilinogen deaminase n=1 Tax=Desulfovibrio porci TaxID=2605782 RepID=A0A6L5XLM8_9BACT|nr:hydroxymethylbilane synthase [Desulfovibrio porci]MSS27751.1 hydroxymethylbilane synthase [Desulfovibrio porci]
MRKHLVIATRGSRLALWQAEHVKSRLEAQDPELTVSLNVIKTRGDIILDVPLSKVGGKGLFVKEIEEALLDGRADLAVHSIKDVPMVLPEGLILGCVPSREACTDCFLSFNHADVDALPQGAHVGTSSLRRQAQLLALRPDLRISSLRGNVDTRLRKLRDGDYDAIILASAGLNRLGLSAPYMTPLDPERFLPAVGQGALGIECREDNYDLLVLLAGLEDRATRVCVDAERGFLAGLEGGCQVPIAGHARLVDEENVSLEGLVAEVDGSLILRGAKSGNAADARALGLDLARELLDRGGRAILAKLYQQQ